MTRHGRTIYRAEISLKDGAIMANPKKKPYSLTPRQRLFVAEYLHTNNATEAARIAGLKCPEMAGPRMLRNDRIRAALEEATANLRAQFVREAMVAFRTLMHLMEHSTVDLVRLQAAKDILDRAGYKPIEKREITGIQTFVRSGVDYNDPDAVARRLEELRERQKEIEEGRLQH